MISRSAVALLLSLISTNSATASDADPTSSSSKTSRPSWQKFGTNVNYRITAILDVNGGADEDPNFESSFLQDDAATKTKSIKTPGYSIPIDVLTLQDPTTGEWRQRVSYYSGMQVDYNKYGEGYKVVSTPYAGIRNNAERGHDPKKRTCFFVGGNSTNVKERVGYLNFFPTVEQMEHYRLGKLITSEPGIPYRIASLEAPHGSYNATSDKFTQPDASYDAHPGMPSHDWFQFHYEESLSSSGYPGVPGNVNVARPLKWTMLARNQIMNAHTENWVVRYLSYEAIDENDERELWEKYFDTKFEADCGEENGIEAMAYGNEGHHNLQLNRLGMFFSTSSSSHSPHDIDMMKGSNIALPSGASSSHNNSPYSHFDLFLARHNKHYPHPKEYLKRKEVHDANRKNIERWNKEHAGKTTFVANEFLDLEAKEVMAFRGGHIPRGKGKIGQGNKSGMHLENRRHLRQAISGDDSTNSAEVTENVETFTEYQVPKDFDPSTLPETFDWRDHLPGSVSPIKDQGFCGSCWAFSFISALESHWFIANGQSVDLPEQFVNDCAWSDAVHACDGGESAYAAQNIIERFRGMVPTRDVYGGYLSVDGGCYIDILQNVGVIQENYAGLSMATSSTVQLVDWVVLPERDDIAVKHALYTKGPLSIALNVVDEALYYANGVLDVESCGEHDEENLDHAINVVGWGIDELPDGTKSEHWVLRNSWSDLWGDSGYFKVRMGDRDCGVTTSVGYPVVVTKPAQHAMVEPSKNVAMS